MPRPSFRSPPERNSFTEPFRVQVLCDISLEYFRNVVLGAHHYAFMTRKIEMVSRWMDNETDQLEQLIKRDRIDGIVAAAHIAPLEKRLATLSIPVVNVSNVTPRPLLPLVTQDDEQVGRIAAEHLISSGCRTFGFWEERESRFSAQRLAGFRVALEKHGLGGSLHIEGQYPPGIEPTEVFYGRMVKWLRHLPRPLGIFCVLDTQALYMLRAVWAQSWNVPDDVAVLGAGDDEFWVKFENVPLSSVKLPSFRIGYEAASLLEKLMSLRSAVQTTSRKSRRNASEELKLPANEIAVRQSTDSLFVEDQAVVKAVRYIRSNAASDVYADAIVAASGIARTALQKRFKIALGHSLMDELTMARITLAQGFLANSDLSMDAVAERCGLPSSHRLSVVFGTQVGMTPTEYRRKFRQASR